MDQHLVKILNFLVKKVIHMAAAGPTNVIKHLGRRAFLPRTVSRTGLLCDWRKMINATTALIVVALSMLTAALAESPYCMPKADGTNRFPETGSAYPTGYISTGRCCEARRSCAFGRRKSTGATDATKTSQSRTHSPQDLRNQ
jgi:hypothetical protein